MNVQTTWVSPARVITGQDHLAVSAISQHLFTELLPGLTNVTQRIRCYSFYPWFVWAFDQRAAKKSANEIVRTFRRAEVLHSLIGILHELDEDDEWPHGGGLVGRDVLVPVARAILDGRTVRLSKYAVLDSENGPRYFKHRLGGLGQYYLGPLRELMVLDGNARSGLRCINEWGGHLAALYDTAVDGDAFFAAIEGDRVDAAVLRKLRAFCPCRLAGSQGERGALGQLMFGTGDGELAQEGGDSRRNTLFALLEYVRDARQNSPRATDEWSFLATACAGALLDGSPWAPSDLLRDVVRQWGVYQRHEIFSVAMQGLFWAALTTLTDEEAAFTESRTAFARWFARRFAKCLPRASRKSVFGLFVAHTAAGLPHAADWGNPEHEIAVAREVIGAQNAGDVDRVVELALQALAALVARGTDTLNYGTFDLSARFLQIYAVNLVSLRDNASGRWVGLTGVQWLEWMAAHWLLDAHVRVALRKLRHQAQDTFRIVPTDDGFRVRPDVPTAAFAQPRLGSALRFLFDLGLLELDQEAEGLPYRLSAVGVRTLETALG
ncbi:MAG: hypothetical protein IT182_16905 [Acidobacteria bacterium]|nr:hypothetical protein [Acidobacteriota bacterium]